MPEEQPIKLGQPVQVTITPNERGVALTVKPHMSQFDLASLLNQAAGSVILDTYMLVTVFLSKRPEEAPSVVRVVSETEVDPASTAEVLRRLADGIEAGNSF